MKIYPDLKEFLRLSRKGNVIPVFADMNADTDTPVSAFLKLKDGGYSFLLESVEGQEKIARYSFLGANPALIFRSSGSNIEIIQPKKGIIKRFACVDTPLDEIRRLMTEFKPVAIDGLPRFYGGLVGYLSYDMVRFFEKIPDGNPDTLGIPESVFMLTDSMIVFDHFKHRLKIVYNVILPGDDRFLSRRGKRKAYEDARRCIMALSKQLSAPARRSQQKHPGKAYPVASEISRAGFKNMVSRAKSYIRRGDVIQVVLSQRFRSRTDKKHFDIYRNLRSLNPSPYMFFLKLGDFSLVGSSPEMLVRCEGDNIQMRPIAGTRPRSSLEAQDLKFESQLRKSRKERAEHIMLVDLGRNDLGRICRTASVKVEEFMSVERYSHVMHLVSCVKGLLDNKRHDIYDVLKATFPAGTVSGSPKIRAMEIIDELEGARRSSYAGCVGYISFSKNLDTCITIRTILLKGKDVFIQAGAGIVADSDPQREYQETVNKAKALFEALSR